MPDRRRGRLPLAVVVLTLNEEAHLPECLASAAGLAERVLVVDSGSQDQTAVIARQIGADVVIRRFDGYASQRNAALALIDQPWVLFLDADERLTPALRREIASAIAQAPDDVAGYWIPRRNVMFGRELRGGGWWPDEQLRLLRTGRARYCPGREVHEVVRLDGRGDFLREPLLHLNYDTRGEFREKQRHYSAIQATGLARRGIQPRARTYLGQPAREFWRRFVTLSGYRDGRLGLTLAGAMAWYELRTWLGVRQQMRQEHPKKIGPEAATTGPRTQGAAWDGPELSIVIVSYNVRELLLACLASIEASLATSQIEAEVIVVDNASTDGSADSVRRRFPQTRVIESDVNAGFAAANNRGIARARGRYIALLNPDTRVVGDAFGVLTRYLDGHSDAGVVGPALVYPDGTRQSTRRRFPTLATGFLESTLVQDYWHQNRVLRRYYMTDQPDDATQEVDWLVGACLVTRRAVIEQAGAFDERFFMYSEEIEWCHRVQAAGWRVVYVPEAVIIHHEGASSRQDIPSRQIDFDTSKVLLFELLHGQAAARLLRAYLLGTYLARVGIEGSKGALGHKRSLRRERIRLYLRAFRSGLRPGRSAR